MSAPGTTPAPGWTSSAPWAGVRSRPAPSTLLAIMTMICLLLVIGSHLREPAPVTPSTPFPHSAALERATGVQFSRVAVVGDGGLVMVEYVVQDVEKATAFQADRANVPTIASQSREAATNRVSIMKPGHLIRPGQTFYFVYQNTRGALRPGERATITYRDLSLRDVPVL